jgi:hypothetical protein
MACGTALGTLGRTACLAPYAMFRRRPVHHTIELGVPASATDEFLGTLNGLDGVLSLSVERGASIKPPGDMITVHALNRTVDDVLATARRAEERRGG